MFIDKLGFYFYNQQRESRMSEKKDIKNLIPLVEFLMELGNVLESVIKDKNYAAFFSLTDELMAFQAVNWAEVIPELKDLSQDEKTELVNVASKKFDLKNDNFEFVIEEAISILLSAGYLVKRCVDLKDQFSSK
jgi:hypothetical protein|tara:strand:- start:1645 stop:2046 length:402 start_codon:yes stop_codon:yes gene_type:complete